MLLMPLQIRPNFDGFGQGDRDWHDLLNHNSASHPFLTPNFQKIWWRYFGEGELKVITIRETSGKLVVLAPLMLKDNNLSLVGGAEVADYLDVLIDPENEAENYRQMWLAIMSLNWSRLKLLPLPSGSLSLKYFRALAEADGLTVTKKVKAPVFSLALPKSWEGYLAGLPRHNRHELQRKLRRLSVRGQVELYRTTDPQKLAGDLNIFFRLLRASRETKAVFLDLKMENFFRDLAVAFFPEKRLRLEFLLLDKMPIAAAFAFRWNGSLLLYNSGFDPAYTQLAPGFALAAFCLKEAIAQGLDKFDFMQGAERYKKDLGGQEDLVYTLEISRRDDRSHF